MKLLSMVWNLTQRTQYGVPLNEEKISVATTHNFKIVFDFTDENRFESKDFTILQPIIYYTLIT
jgi:hypothetical protein